MDPIKDIIADVIGKISSGKPGGQELQAAWERISKDKGSKVVELKNGSVTISADSSLRLIRLNLNREILLKELQKEFPSIIKINFKVGT